MTPTREQRTMVAHLCDIVSHALRSEQAIDCGSIMIYARWALELAESAEGSYRDALATAGLSPADIDAAVAAIADGKHPHLSLPGKIEKMMRTATCFVNALPEDSHAVRASFAGAVYAHETILCMLGCEVTAPSERQAMRAHVADIISEALVAMDTKACTMRGAVDMLHTSLTAELLGCGVPSPSDCDAIVGILVRAVASGDVHEGRIKALCYRVRNRSMSTLARVDLERMIREVMP